MLSEMMFLDKAVYWSLHGNLIRGGELKLIYQIKAYVVWSVQQRDRDYAEGMIQPSLQYRKLEIRVKILLKILSNFYRNYKQMYFNRNQGISNIFAFHPIEWNDSFMKKCILYILLA